MAADAAYQHVVVGTDGSATARHAVTHAAALAHAAGARLTVVSAYTRSGGNPAELGVPMTETDAAAASAHVVGAQEIARGVGVGAIGGRTEAGDPAAVILDIATELGADLIVVGSRGMASASRFLLGSVPNRVSHHAPCDVLIVRTAD